MLPAFKLSKASSGFVMLMMAFSCTPGRILGSLLMFEMATRNELTSLGFSNIAPLKPTIRGEREREKCYVS